jgi:hypothetical protein
LNFQLGIDGARRVESAINDVRDALIEAQAAVEALDGRTIDLDLDVDRDAIENALSGTVAVESGSAVSGAADAAAEATSEAADAASDAATSWDQVTGKNQSYARILSRLNDEAFAVSGLFAKMGGVTTAAIAGVTTATAALAGVSVAVGGLAAAATGLATKFGDLELRSDLARVKGAFQGLARSFVRQFEPLIRDEIIPAGLQLVDEIEAVIPDLVDLSRTWLPSLIDSVEGLVTSIDEVADGLSIAASLGDIIFESTEAVLEILPALAEGLLRNLKLLSEKITGFELPTGALTFYKNALLESGKSIESSTRTILGGGDLPGSERDARSGGAVAARKGPSGTSAGDDLQEFVKVRREVEGIRRAMEETTEAGRPLVSQAEGLKSQFRLVQDALISMTKQGIDNSQFEEFKGLLEEIRKRAKAAGVELGTTVEQAKELPEIETFSDRLSQFREATRGVMEGGKAPVAPLEGPVPAQISAPQVPIDQLRQLAQTASSIEEVNSLLAITRRKMENVGTEGKIALESIRGSLKATKDQLQNSTDQVEKFAKKLRQISVKQFLRLGDAIAENLVSGISDAITGLSKVEQIQKRLSKLQLQKQIKDLRSRLSEATGIDAQVINTRIDLLTEKLEEARSEAGRLGRVFRDIRSAIVNTLRSVIREAIALIAKMYIIKGLSAALGGPVGGGVQVASSFIAQEGGFVEEGGFARIHKGESIVTADAVKAFQKKIGSLGEVGDSLGGLREQLSSALPEMSVPSPDGIVPDILPADVPMPDGGEPRRMIAASGIGTIQKAGTSKTRLAGGEVSVSIPVEVVNQANKEGERRIGRTGR